MINKFSTNDDIINYNNAKKLSAIKSGNKITLKNNNGGEWYFKHNIDDEIWTELSFNIVGVDSIIVYVHSWINDDDTGGLVIYPMIGDGSKNSTNGLIASLIFEV
jgi:hypothetical protein